jgi:hypothetical protein
VAIEWMQNGKKPWFPCLRMADFKRYMRNFQNFYFNKASAVKIRLKFWKMSAKTKNNSAPALLE